MLESVCRPASSTSSISEHHIAQSVKSQSADSVSILSSPPSPAVRRSHSPLGLGNPTEKSYSSLVKIAFQSLTLVCDAVSSLSPAHLRLCISTLGHLGQQADTNIALTAAASLLWSVSDAIQSKRKKCGRRTRIQRTVDVPLARRFSASVPILVLKCAMVRSKRFSERCSCMGATLSLETWDQCIWKVTFPLLDALTAEIRHLGENISEPRYGGRARLGRIKDSCPPLYRCHLHRLPRCQNHAIRLIYQGVGRVRWPY